MIRSVAQVLARRGFEVRRHPATRRQSLLEARGVDLVLDVGAAKGGYGTQLRSFGYSGHIVSFEPMATAYTLLCEAAAGDPLWQTRQCALGSKAGRATINVASNSDSSSLLPMLDAHTAAAPHVTYVRQEEITVERLDDVAAELLPDARRTFLKIDTQGFEREVLAGATQTLTTCVGLQLELSFVPLYDGGMLIDEAVTWAYGAGFRLVSVEQGHTAPTGEMLQIDGVFLRENP
jgi:FkbM family methyltransferase